MNHDLALLILPHPAGKQGLEHTAPCCQNDAMPLKDLILHLQTVNKTFRSSVVHGAGTSALLKSWGGKDQP